MNAANLVGSISAILTTCAFLPQVLQIWKTRTVRDVSLPMYLIFSAGLSGWIVYGLIVQSWPVIIYNAVTLLLSLAVITMKLRWRAS